MTVKNQIRFLYTNKRQNAKTTFHFFVCLFCRVVQVAKTKKWNFISSFLRFVALVKARKRTNEKTQKWNFISSFVRFVALYKSPKRRNGISFLRFFVLSRWSRRKNEQTRKRRNGISFLRLFVLSRCTSCQNEEMDFISSFVRFVALVKARQNDKTTKRQSYREILKFDFSWLLVRFVVCSFCRLPQGTKTTERQRDKMRFCGHFVLSFVRFVALYKSPKRRNEISFWRLFVLSPSIRRQNEQTKWPYPASIPNQDKRGSRYYRSCYNKAAYIISQA